MCKNKLTKYSGNCNWMDKLFHIKENNTPLLTGLLAYWTFDNTLEDVTGRGNNGTGINNPGYVAGVSGNAINFVAASHQSVQVNNSADISPTGTFSMAAWIKVTSHHGLTYIITNDESEASGFDISISDIGAMFVEVASGDFATATPNPIPLDTWIFVLFGWDEDTNRIFIQVNGGTTVYASSAGQGTPAAPMYFGSYDGGSNWFDGAMTQVGLWNRLLTSDEITTLASGAIYPF